MRYTYTVGMHLCGYSDVIATLLMDTEMKITHEIHRKIVKSRKNTPEAERLAKKNNSHFTYSIKLKETFKNGSKNYSK